MKKLLIGIVALALCAGVSIADTITLDSPESLSVPSATTMDWKITLIDAANKTMHVTYRWRDATDSPIYLSDGRSA